MLVALKASELHHAALALKWVISEHTLSREFSKRKRKKASNYDQSPDRVEGEACSTKTWDFPPASLRSYSLFNTT
jgi:hypothetical protein